MNSAIEVLGGGVLAPAAISVAVFALLRRCLAAETAERYAAPLAVAVGYCVGYAITFRAEGLVPKRHWHWTPYLALLAVVMGAISQSGGLKRFERWLLTLFAAFVAAWFLVPTWGTLKPGRTVWIPVLAGYFFLLATALEPVARRLSARLILALLTFTAAAVAALIAAFVSLTYAQAAGTVAAALGGALAATWLTSKTLPPRGLGFAYAVLVGGWAFVGCVEPQEPIVWLLIVPASAVVLGYFAGWLRRSPAHG